MVASEGASDEAVGERVERRAIGRYFNVATYRANEEQKALIDYSAKREGKSIQKLLEGIIMPTLEDRYGIEFDQQ